MKSFKLFFLFLLGALHFNLSAQNNPNFYLHENGVTCMCPNAAVGETGTVNGVTYTKRTREQINEYNASTTCTSGITNMKNLIGGTYERPSKFNADISTWDVSNVTDMSNMFSNATNFNQPIGNWDVSNVTNMSSMFFESKAFNQPIGNWNVINVTNMRNMFGSAESFNQPIGNWNVSNVTDMFFMFRTARSFNQPIGNWNVSKVTNMLSMFDWADKFNQPIDNWDVSNVTDMSRMFISAHSFNQPIGNWNVSNVTNMQSMFNNADSFNQPIGNWNVSNVTDMRSMFNGADSFNHPIGNWDVSGLTVYNEWYGSGTLADSMFYYAFSFNQDISNWCMPKITKTPKDFSTESPLQESFKPKWGAECTTLSNEEFTNLSTQLTISPNPFTNSVKINLPENTQANQIQVLNAVGQTVYTSAETELNLEYLPAGMYFVKINTNQGIATEKIIKN